MSMKFSPSSNLIIGSLHLLLCSETPDEKLNPKSPCALNVHIDRVAIAVNDRAFDCGWDIVRESGWQLVRIQFPLL